MAASPGPEVTVTGAISASEAVSIGKQTARVYVPRIIHVDWATVHVLIGVASHVAWKMLAKKYKMIRLKGKFAEHKKLTGDLMRKWCWELVADKL
jgi:hypothetical protein